MRRSPAFSAGATTRSAKSNRGLFRRSATRLSAIQTRRCRMVELDRDGQFLDRFWDDLVVSDDANPGKLDPRAAALVRRMQALAATPPPTSAARERVRLR